MKLFSAPKQDFQSSIIVFFVALPLCLGIALASGAPLFSGIIAGIVGGIVVGSISGSALGVSGPAAGLAVIVFNSILQLGSYEGFLVAVILAGLLQILLGFLRAGLIGYFFPSAVIKGMLSGIGIIIVLKQIPHAFGYDEDYEGDLDFFQMDGQNTFSELFNMLDYFSLSATFVAIVSFIILISWESYLAKKFRVFQLIQGPLVAVGFGIAFQLFTQRYFPSYAIAEAHLVNVPVSADFSAFIAQFTLPDYSFLGNSKVYIIALTMALVASLETLLSLEATDKLDSKKRVTPANRELLAQGTGNVLSGLIGGLPITQVIVRSSANIQSGGKTKLSGILHGIWLLLSIIFIPTVLNYIPLAVLASILIVVGYKLAKPALFKSMYGLGAGQFYPFLVTIIGIVFTDLLTGIGIGMAFAIFFLLKKSYKNSHFLHIKESSEEVHHVEMSLSEEVSFLNKGAILKELNNVPKNSELEIDVSQCIILDYDICEIIENFIENTAPEKGISVKMKGTLRVNKADY